MCALSMWRKAGGRALLLLLSFVLTTRAEVTVQEACVQMSAVYGRGQITLQWQGDGNATGYEVSRKLLGAEDWTALGAAPGSAVTWVDAGVPFGEAFEYRVIKHGANGYDGFGYIAVGADRLPVENRGRVILLVADHLAAALPFELTRFTRDLTGDGWQVIQRNISTNLSAIEVKAIVRTEYQRDPASTKALFLFGHIAVPYSGELMPDGHEDHRGAWPADVYYGEFDGEWTDALNIRTNGFNRNVAGDGRFDQSYAPGRVRLGIGRVDLANLTCFANKTPPRYEVDLARQYLNKNHLFRHGGMDVRRRALVFDRQFRGTEIEPQTSMAWRAFPAFFARDEIRILGQFEFFPLLENEPYLWSYVVSGGSQVGSDYIGTSDSFALNDPKVVFTSFLGSYFGDWDRESNFLRSALGTSGYTLASLYGGQPAWLLHPMGVGEPIGYSAMLTQNNRTNGVYVAHPNWGIGQVHIALLGDPTLRMHPLAPVRQLTGTINGNGTRLSWQPSSDAAALGVHIYKSASSDGPFNRLTTDLITGDSYTDPQGQNGDYYMVRVVKREITPSGNYYNLSQGIFFPASDTEEEVAVEAPANVGVGKITPGAITLEWNQRGSGMRGYQIQRRLLPSGTFATIGEADANALSYVDHPAGGAAYGYRVKTLGYAGDSDYSAEATVNLNPSGGLVAGNDAATSGDWIGRYGQQGLVIPYIATNLPSYMSLSSSNLIGYVNSWTWTNSNGLTRLDGESRVATYWYGGQNQTLGLSFRFNDSAYHRVSFYIVDFEKSDRHGRIEIVDPFNNTVLASTIYTNVANGVYYSFDLRNYADIRLIAGRSNPVMSGLFFSEPSLDAPQITPGSGTFAVRTGVQMTSLLASQIRYTLDGADPGPGSTLYTGPFLINRDVNIVARAYRDGYEPSPATRVSLVNSVVTSATFVGIDPWTQGDFQGKYGQDGWLAVGAQGTFHPEVEYLPPLTDRWTWSDSSSERRALNVGRAGRLASAWYSTSEVSFDLELFGQGSRQLALYFLDWDYMGRVEEVTVSSSAGEILDQRRVESFSGGKYFVWDVSGNIHVTIRRISGQNAILNAIFVGEPRAISVEPPTLGSVVSLESGIQSIRVSGQPGQTFILQRSNDLNVWVDVQRRTLSGTTMDLNIPFIAEPGLHVFRAKLDQ
jgi:hypothetical protein